MDPYDIARIFVSMEYDLIASMKRNLVRHLAEEAKEGFEWEQWQQRKLEGLKQYRELLDKYEQMADKETESLLRDSFRQGGKNVDSAVSRLWKRPQPFFIAERMLTKPITLPLLLRLTSNIRMSPFNTTYHSEYAVTHS